MSRRWLVLVACATACASTEVLDGSGPPDESRGVPEPGPSLDGGLDAAREVDACPDADCEYFPEVCSPDSLCPNGPFDSTPSGDGLDPLLMINVIRGRSTSDIWAAGAMGAIAHFDGPFWTRSDLGSRETLKALWLLDSGEVTFGTFSRTYTRGLEVGDAGAGASAGGWTLGVPAIPPDLRPTQVQLGSTWSAPGSKWLWCAATPIFQGSGLWRMRRSPEAVLAVEAGGAADVCSVEPCGRMNSIHGASANELWAVGEVGSAVRITGADGDSPVIQGFNTQTWNALNGVWAASPTDVWAVGAGGTVRHYTGDAMLWETVAGVPTNEVLRAISGSSSSDIWAVGDAGIVLHYDGKSWSRVKVAGLGPRRPDFTTVWVAAPGHVWVGAQGVILSLGGKP